MRHLCTKFVIVCVLLLTRTELLNSKVICPTQLCKCIGNFSIDCTGKGLKTIPKFALSNETFYAIDFFENPIYVYKNRNHISEISSESFKNIINVEKIDLRSVVLTHIDSKAFIGVEHYLKELYIEGNGIYMLNLPFLKGLMKLKLLHLENFGLTDVIVDNPLKELISLESIRVKRCINLTSLGNNTFVNMANLKMLHLETLPSLKTVPTAIQNLQTLMILTIHKTSISHLDENSFKGLTKLESLDLSKNHLMCFDHATFTDIHETLKYLDLSLNELSESSLSLLTAIKWINLRTLKLSQNPITNLNEGFFYNMSTLQILILNQCKLRKLQNTTFAGLEHLNALDISMNEIGDVEVGSFLPTPNLTILDLHDQHQVPSCHLLHSSGHPPLSLPPETLWHLRFYLTHLDLGYNILNLTDTYKMIRSLSNLKGLGLKCIGLEEIPAYLFSNHSNLQMLYLDDNNINKLSPQTLYGLSSSLRELYLNNNKLKTLHKCVLENFNQLQKLELKDNEWICDCNFIWLYDRIYGGSFKTNFLKCAIPAEYKSLYLKTLSRNMLACRDDYFRSNCPIRFHINITTLSQTSLRLTWSVIDKSLLSGYMLEVMNLQNRTSNIIKFKVDLNSYILTELEPGTPYQICLLMVISEIVKANLESCKTFEIPALLSSKDYKPTYQGQTISAKPIIFKSLAIIGAFAFIIIVMTIIVLLLKTPRKNTSKLMQLVIPQECDRICAREEIFLNSFYKSDSSNAHIHKCNDNPLSLCSELTIVAHEKLRERCKHLLNTCCDNDEQITCVKLVRSVNETRSPNTPETDGLQTGSSIIYTEVDTSQNPCSETWDNEEEITSKRPSVHTTVTQDSAPACPSTEMYSEINEVTMDNAMAGKGSKSDLSILKQTKSTTRNATLTSPPHILAASRQKSFIYEPKKMIKKSKTKVGGLNTRGRKKRSKSNEEFLDKERQDDGVGQCFHMSDSEYVHKKNPELTSTNKVKSNYIRVKQMPKISQNTKLYFKPTKSESDENDYVVEEGSKSPRLHFPKCASNLRTRMQNIVTSPPLPSPWWVPRNRGRGDNPSCLPGSRRDPK
ncbi:hypothetical protein CHS0354_024631 [Potamilus streckersoni]|uniref:Fibronectin type-III domain-containing protein n=1 Tax=Potamilus streckersoni TaxID=2493646 RepID=A0AAE0SVS5_9BIVA|nr:hypothetical protein CHS0354_024631 [Potamilus streckersoni]